MHGQFDYDRASCQSAFPNKNGHNVHHHINVRQATVCGNLHHRKKVLLVAVYDHFDPLILEQMTLGFQYLYLNDFLNRNPHEIRLTLLKLRLTGLILLKCNLDFLTDIIFVVVQNNGL